MGSQKKKKSMGFCGWFLVAVVLALLVAAIVVVIKKRSGHGGDEAEPVPGPPGAVVEKYSDALKIAVQFFDVQKSGKLENNKIPWRGDSGLDDGKEAKLDLSKGLYDAGDNMKFGFPMAFTATVLSWAILEYGDQMAHVKQLEPARDSLMWITDFLLAAHPEDNVLYVQVGDPKADHKCWERPENMTEKRPLAMVNTSSPGSDVVAETAAALASASIVFNTVSTSYSMELIAQAEKLFSFADKYQGFYSKSIPQVQTFYNSTGFHDELLWAASWLYHSTGEMKYLDYVAKHGEAFANFGTPTWFCWDNKLAATQVLLSRVNFFTPKVASSSVKSSLEMYQQTAEAVMCGLFPDSPTATSSRTDGGLIWVSEWNSLQHPVASAFLATVYSDYMLTSRTAKISCSGTSYKPSDLKEFAKSQVDYVLGDNPMGMSYLVGYGDKYPQFVHHRGASIPKDAKTGCTDGFKWLKSTKPNPNVAIGALVGGPFLNETYIDSRNNSMQGEPSTYNSALLVGLLSGLVTTSSVDKTYGFSKGLVR